ncbi:MULTISPECIES: hypothetical protein [unclassified Arthrobacter]|uniref:hypothetical protein n=1 Tax=unclassified Arthrobacter TaxID=235627 RepID=UPI0009A838EA|nr:MULTISPECIES: hypothetical protein [unclassified Arthrobacter]MDF2050070.1 hypothetical protein [Arthrobacter sp. Cr_A7]RDV09404.1 hypothetical protein DXK94_13535 [Arthrobacter sp. RT-1]SLK13835.1 hypothetical protein SAMN06272721_11948 [Arthrobacter sp. P2b]
MGEILMAIATAFLIPALSAVWSRRRKSDAEAAESLIFGLLILAAAISCFYFGLTLPIAVDVEVLETLLVILKIMLFAAGVFGGMAAAAIIWESFKGFSEGTKRG